MLPRKERLEDVADVEKLVGSVLQKFMRRHRPPWGPDEREEAMLDLLEHVYILHRHKWDPRRQPSFASYASWKLEQVAVDEFVRRRLGRTGQKRALVFTDSVEDLSSRDQLEQALAASASDRGTDSPADLGRLLTGGDRAADTAARAEVIAAASQPRRLGRLIAELREEVEAIAGDFDAETDDLVEQGQRLDEPKEQVAA